MKETGTHLKPKIRIRKKGRHLAGWVAPAHLAAVSASARPQDRTHASRSGRHTRRRKRKFLLWTAVAVLIAAAALAGWKLIGALLQYDRDRAADAGGASTAVFVVVPPWSANGPQDGELL
jgi:hypothetical protein